MNGQQVLLLGETDRSALKDEHPREDVQPGQPPNDRCDVNGGVLLVANTVRIAARRASSKSEYLDH